MIDIEIPTRQQLDDLINGDQRLLRSIDSLFQYVGFFRNRQMFYAKNTSGLQVNKATAVMFTGVDDVGDTPTFLMEFAPADASTGPRSKFMGISLNDTINGQFGYVVNFGEISGLDTTGPGSESWADGDVLYIDTATPGQLSNVAPSSGFVLPIARVLRANASNGVIFVNNTFSEGNN